LPITTHDFTYATLANKDEALRIALLILLKDPNYQKLPLRQVSTFYKSIVNNYYQFMIQGNKAVGVIMWLKVSAAVRDNCILLDRSVLVSELSHQGDAIYCIAFAALEPKFLLPLLRYFIKSQSNQDILIKRHFKNGIKVNQPIILVKNQKRVKPLYEVVSI
jgi:hemolysin-activating ACP:hemolysin acyltransferase